MNWGDIQPTDGQKSQLIDWKSQGANSVKILQDYWKQLSSIILVFAAPGWAYYVEVVSHRYLSDMSNISNISHIVLDASGFMNISCLIRILDVY